MLLQALPSFYLLGQAMRMQAHLLLTNQNLIVVWSVRICCVEECQTRRHSLAYDSHPVLLRPQALFFVVETLGQTHAPQTLGRSLHAALTQWSRKYVAAHDLSVWQCPRLFGPLMGLVQLDQVTLTVKIQAAEQDA